MLELDIVLQRFMDQHFDGLTLAELSAFDDMLAMPDNEFWNVLHMKNLHFKNAAQQSIILKINT